METRHRKFNPSYKNNFRVELYLATGFFLGEFMA